MQDDKEAFVEPGRDERADTERAAERDELLAHRRARQSTTTDRKKAARITMSLGLLGGAALIFVIAVGPLGALKILGVVKDGPQTSKVDMEVDRERKPDSHLDFVVPPAPELPEKKPVDPNVAWSERFKELQAKLDDMERQKRGTLTADNIREMLSGYNEEVARKFETERKAMAEENARLQAQAREAEEERRKAEEEAKLMSANAKEQGKIEKMQRESKSVLVDDENRITSQQQEGDDGAHNSDRDGNQRFLKAAASSVVQTSVSQKLADPARMIVQGTIISAVLETAIDTQLPGAIRAQVMQPVYSFDGSQVLMPPGTVLIGQFNNDVDIAQKRVLIAWNRAITPDGKSIAIGSIGTDRLGRSGTLGNVDNRYGTKFGAAILTSAITAIPSALSKGSGSSGSGTTVNIGGQMASNAGSDLSDQTSGTLEKYLSLAPVIRIPQGEEIRVFVNRDLLFR